MFEPLTMNRRDLLRTGTTATVGLLSQWATRNLCSAGTLVSERHYEVVKIDRTTVRLPYRAVPRRNMDRELPHWRWVEICEI